MAATAAAAVTATSEALTEIAFCELHQTGLMPVFFRLSRPVVAKIAQCANTPFSNRGLKFYRREKN